ncbi:RNA-protein complex protein Nop10 [Conexivisphaera calida]|uniref:RNA-protein complex protein Nop10 n=1 Tax=Conexivisphaera calida TaxID=1874277 RepID=UPI00157B90BC
MRPRLLRVCRKCNRYTFEQTCPICGGPTEIAHPPPFSPDDKYLELRMKALRREDGPGTQDMGSAG